VNQRACIKIFDATDAKRLHNETFLFLLIFVFPNKQTKRKRQRKRY
jgi:hypothetical protein